MGGAQAPTEPEVRVGPDPSEPGASSAGPWNRALGLAANALNAIGSLWIFGLMLMMLADMAARFAFNRPIAGVAELAGLSIVGIVYLQLAATVHSGRMTRADFLSGWLTVQVPALGHALEALFHLLGAVTMGVLAWVSLGPLRGAWVDHETLGTAGVFLVATWPFRALVVVGSSLAGLCYLLRAVEALTRLRSARATP